MFLIPLLCSSQVVIKGSVVRSSGKIRLALLDVVPPTIVLNGANPLSIAVGETFIDPGFTATDDVDGDITGNVVVGGQTVDVNTIGVYTITYNVADAASNNATQVTRTVNVNVGGVVNLLSNGTFNNADGWDLLNGSTATGGILTVVGNGNAGFDTPNWSATYPNVLNDIYYKTRRFRVTFEARQTNGNGDFQVYQGFSSIFQQQLTSSFATYTADFDGNDPDHRNNLIFAGLNVGDEFEVQNVVLEIIGGTTNPNVPGEDAQVIFLTDFEPAGTTYTYEQWGANGANPAEINQWEVDHGDPRTTATSGSPLTSGREGTGRALWLGAYNAPDDRNEVGKDILQPFGEQWVSFSVYPHENTPGTRLFYQLRCLAPGGSSTVNALSLRHDSTTNRWYFSLPTNVANVDQTQATLGTWNGAGTNTQSVFFDYNFQGWNDIVIHYKGAFGADYTGPDTSSLVETFGYDPRSDGFIEIWVNGNKIVDHVGTTLYRYERNGGEIRFGFTPKIGPYWSNAFAPQGEYYYDNFKVWVGPGGSLAEMNPSN